MTKTVLVVDDDAGIRELLKFRLERNDFAVETGSNGDECIEFLRTGPLPAVVLLDVRMPRTDGIDVLETIRAEVGDDLPVVLLTGTQSQTNTEDTTATERIDKPFRMDEVFTCIERVL